MKFDDLDAKMRVFETAHDHCVLPEIFIVARLDGRGFTRQTKEVHHFEAPFDVRFRDHMIPTVEHLMDCGFRITQSGGAGTKRVAGAPGSRPRASGKAVPGARGLEPGVFAILRKTSPRRD
jgi:hypothetical protein